MGGSTRLTPAYGHLSLKAPLHWEGLIILKMINLVIMRQG